MEVFLPARNRLFAPLCSGYGNPLNLPCPLGDELWGQRETHRHRQRYRERRGRKRGRHTEKNHKKIQSEERQKCIHKKTERQSIKEIIIRETEK